VLTAATGVISPADKWLGSASASPGRQGRQNERQAANRYWQAGRQTKMKRHFYIILVFLVSRQVLGQTNLVPNPSFEDTVDNCVNSFSNPTFDAVTKARYWKNASMTPDYFHSCAPPTLMGVPKNVEGFQYAASGNAYCGFVACIDAQTSPPNLRETLMAQLIQTLTVGQKYYVTLKVARSESDCWACDKIGVKFTTYDPNPSQTPNNPMPNGLINNVSQVYATSIITDSTNWTTIKGSFVADLAYKYIIIGNFFQDQYTQISQCSSAGCGYYFVDDVCVSTDSIFAGTWTSTTEKKLELPMRVYPNPASDLISINGIDHANVDRIIIMNNVGQVIWTKQNIADKVDISTIPNGIYLFQILSDGKTYFDKIIIRH
jgi:hypothetical protein